MKKCKYPDCERCDRADCDIGCESLMKTLGYARREGEKAKSCRECKVSSIVERNGIKYRFCETTRRIIDLSFTGKLCEAAPKEKILKIREVQQIDIETDKVIKTYKTAKEAGIALGHEKGGINISAVCRGRYKTMYGYKWRWNIRYERTVIL